MTAGDILTAQRVDDVARDCLYRDDELTTVDGQRQVPEGAVLVEGVVSTFGFHPGRLERHADAIRAMLAELPAEFGEGYSFLAACNDRHGNQWTGMHSTMDALFCLGIAVGAVTCPFPRDMWPMLPGGVPYYFVKVGAS